MSAGTAPRHIVIDDFLPPARLVELDAHAAAQEPMLRKIDVGGAGEGRSYAASRRLWQASVGLGPCEGWFTSAIASRLHDLFLGAGAPEIAVAEYEYELNAQFDGSFFDRHIDTAVASGAERTTDRMLSVVFYFPQPGADFSGGELLLHPFVGSGEPTAIAPRRNRLVAFPSFAWHEVAPLLARDDGLRNARLSVNCWLHRARRPVAE